MSKAGQIINDLFSNEDKSAVSNPTLKTIIINAQNCIFTFSRMMKLRMAESKVNSTDTTNNIVGKFIQSKFAAIINQLVMINTKAFK